MASALMIAMLAMTGCKADSKTSTKETAMTQNVTELIKKDTDILDRLGGRLGLIPDRTAGDFDPFFVQGADDLFHFFRIIHVRRELLFHLFDRDKTLFFTENQQFLNDLPVQLGRNGPFFPTAVAKLNEEEKLLPKERRGDLDMTRFSVLVGKGDDAGADKLAATIQETHKGEPRIGDALDMMRFNSLMLRKDYAAAGKLAAGMSDAHKDNADLQNRLAWDLATVPDAAHRDLALAETIALRANDASKGENSTVLSTLARVLFLEGNKDGAIELQERAVKFAKDSEKKDLQNVLDGYRKAEIQKTN